MCPACRYATSMPVLHNVAPGPHAGSHATRAACRLPVPHACTLLDMPGVRSTRSTCPPRVLRCPANLAYNLPHEMLEPVRGVRPPSFKYILLYCYGWKKFCLPHGVTAQPALVQESTGARGGARAPRRCLLGLCRRAPAKVCQTFVLSVWDFHLSVCSLPP